MKSEPGSGNRHCAAPGSSKASSSSAPATTVIAVIAVPGVVMLIPKFPVIRTLGIYATHPGLIIPLLAAATGVFIMKQFFESIPPSIEDG